MNTPQSTVVGIPVPLPNEEGLNPEPPREYTKNELPEWIKPNPDAGGAATNVIFEVLEIMFFLFCFLSREFKYGFSWSIFFSSGH